ncbi:MAG: cadmium-translocating P-type ATPase [Clostridium sp.]|nr:cadmium-translocating P-type ATPase [Clostridium sp.]
MKQKFTVTGMSCAACSARVEKAVTPISDNVSVNLLAGTMVAEYSCDTNDIINAVKKAGYGCEIFKIKKADNSKDIKNMKLRVILSVIFIIPLMYLSMAHMIGYSLPWILGEHIPNGIGQLIFLIPIIAVNFKFFTNGFSSLFKLNPNMDSLVAIGSGASLIYSLISLIAFDMGHLYFESSGMILALITVGKYLETLSKGKTKDAINSLIDLVPEKSIILKDGVETEIDSSFINLDDLVVIKPGMRIAVDGIITEGNGSVDQSAVTGESVPVDLSEGDKVISGTINKNGNFIFKATAVGEDSTLSRIIALVEDASSSKAPAQRLADKIASVFVPVVILISILAFVVWLIIGKGFEFAFSIGVSVLVISCPCALGLATPCAIMIGTGKGAENGILFKDASALENLGKCNTIVFDKTGTITKGEMFVTDISGNADLDIIYSVENISDHPLSVAICNYCRDNGAKLLDVESSEYIIGKGITAVINGKTYKAGNSKLTGFTDNEFSYSGKTAITVSCDDNYMCTIAIADMIKEDAKEAIEQIKADTIMITGDNEITAYAITQQAGIKNFIASAMPQDKEEKIKELINSGKTVAMIGDGINDSPALTRADVGIAIGAGSDIAIESADVVLVNDKLTDVAKAIRLSKKTLKNIRENLFWAFFYNCLGIPLAAGVFYGIFGWTLNPMIAAACMSLSSVTVVTNALRLRRFK